MMGVWDKIVSLAGSNLGLKGLAVMIAIGLWLAGHRDIERAVEVPVEFRNIPSDLMVMDNRIDYVVLRLTGPRTLISTLDPDELKLSLDLNGAKSGSSSYPLGPGSFSFPRGVQIARVTPPVINLRLEPVAKRALPVTVRLSGKPPAGYMISRTVVEPETVMVQGPADEIRRLAAVETVPIVVEEGRGATKRKVRLSTDGRPLSFFPDQVSVSILLEEERITREFSRIEVQAKAFEGSYSVNPRSVYLRLAGPEKVLGQLDLGSSQVYLDLKGLAAGEHTLSLSFNLPPAVTVLEQRPEQFKVRIMKSAK